MSGIPPTTEGTVLQDIVTQCVEDSEIWFPHQAHDVPFLALALCGEAGEVANVVKKMVRGDNDDDYELSEKLRNEVADVFIYLMNLIGALNLDIVKRYNTIREANEKRFG